MNTRGKHATDDRLLRAYLRMLEYVRTLAERADRQASPALRQLIDAAEVKMIELQELTREEAVKIGAWVGRDLEDAAAYLNRPQNRELIDWLKFDLDLIESRLLELFTSVADRTRIEQLTLEQQAAPVSDYRTGEVTGIGTLYCTACGEAVRFTAIAHIPPCPRCRGTTFMRGVDNKA
jgi:hypothetical protein